MENNVIRKVAILGATGYTGQELVRLLHKHPGAKIAFVSSETNAGASLKSVNFHLPDLTLRRSGEINFAEVDCVFSCLPEREGFEASMQALRHGARVIDLSANFRLRNPAEFKKWYEAVHPNPELLETAVYGLPEMQRDRIPGAQLIANPGCYPTSVLIGLLPLAELKLPLRQVIADAKSGVSGAGAAPKRETSFVLVHNDFKPYKVGDRHRHWPEIVQGLENAGLPVTNFVFAPAVLPVERGILTNLYVNFGSDWNYAEVRQAYERWTEREQMVHLLPEGEQASLQHAVNRNGCVLSLAHTSEVLIVTSVIDNLLKGAASQALQNFNLLFGWPETEGLNATA